MVNCCVPLCNSRPGRSQSKEIRFHEIPARATLREKWVSAISRLSSSEGSKWIPRDCSRVCSLHFLSEDYKQNLKRKLLKPGVVPRIFSHYSNFLPARDIKPRTERAALRGSDGNRTVEMSCNEEEFQCENADMKDIHIKTEPEVQVKEEPSLDESLEEIDHIDIKEEINDFSPISQLVLKEEENETSLPHQTSFNKDKNSLSRKKVENESISFKEVHSNTTKYCDVCKKQLSNKSSLSLHMMIHRGDRPFVCEVCNASYVRRYSLNLHMKIHTGDRPFHCHLCDKSYIRKQNLDIHIVTHLKDRPFHCNLCNKSFSRKQCLEEHIVAHSGNKPFTCKDCNKCFLRKNSLKYHMRQHTGELPYKCDTCSKSFSLKSILLNHMSVHSRLKPHTCAVCRKSFYTTSNLREHMSTHSRVKPYSCVECIKSFCTKRELKRHTLNHTGEHH